MKIIPTFNKLVFRQFHKIKIYFFVVNFSKFLEKFRLTFMPFKNFWQLKYYKKCFLNLNIKFYINLHTYLQKKYTVIFREYFGFKGIKFIYS